MAVVSKVIEPRTGIEPNILDGRVGDHFLSFILDSGASLTIILEEVVEDELLSMETVMIRDVNGGLRRAQVLLTIVPHQITHRVAVAPSESLGGKVLLALGFNKDEDFALVKLS